MKNQAIRRSVPTPASRGHQWRHQADIAPQVLAIVHAVTPLRREARTHRHAHWVLDYNFTPMGRVRVGANRAPWHPRHGATAHLYDSGVSYREDARALSRQMAETGYIIFTDGAALGLTRWTGSRGYARFEDPAGQLGDLIRSAADVAPGESAKIHAHAALWRAVSLLHEARPVAEDMWRIADCGESSGGVPVEQTLVQRVQALLRSEVHRHMTLRDLARRLAVSPSTLTHAYRKQSGETPMATLRRLRIDLAKGLLLKGLPLKAIAAQTGFADAFHLSRTFSRCEGLSPREFTRLRRSVDVGGAGIAR